MKIIDIVYTMCYNLFTKKGVGSMAKGNVNFRLDDDIKNGMEEACREMGLSMTTAFTIFAKKVSREKRIPFEISADPFYSASNVAHLLRGVEALNSGKGVEHDIIEDDD